MPAERPGPVARRRAVSSRRAPVVAVTGAGTPAGRAVVAALAARIGPGRSAIRRVIAIGDDARSAQPEEPGPEGAPGPVTGPGVDWQQADLSSPLVAAPLAGAEIVVHVVTQDQVGAERDPMQRRVHAVRAAQAVSTAAAAVGARRLIGVTSAMVFGARPDNPIPLDDACPFRTEPDDGVAGDLVEVERVLERIPRVHPGLSLTLVRPAALVGPGVDTAITRHFEAPRLLVLRGQAMAWQFCHVDDLARAVCTVIEQDTGGQLTVAAPGVLSEADVERLSGMRRLEVPAALAFSTAERLHKVGVLHQPASELTFVVHPWVVGGQSLAPAGWSAEHDNEDCLRVLLQAVEERRRAARAGARHSGRRDAAMGAAGAAVALVGTAAILRQARSRRGRRPPPSLGS